MAGFNEELERECLEILIAQNPMLGKDSILALLNDIKKNVVKNGSTENIKTIILNHNY